MTSNRDRAADILATAGAYCGQCCFGECGEPDCPRTTDWRTCPDCASVVNGYARRLADAGVLAPDDQFRAARGVLTEWWLNLDQSTDPRASAVGAVIDMMDDQMKAAAHAQKKETNE